MFKPTVITTDKKHKKTNVFKREQKENKKVDGGNFAPTL